MKQSVFIQRCRSILSDNQGQRWHPAQRYGTQLDQPRLALVPGGFDRVFRRPAERLYKDYHIGLYVDVSGSMSGARLEHACSAAHALHYAMETAGCQVYTAGFADEVGDLTPASRLGPTELHTACQTNALGGGTKDYMAIQDGMKRLAGKQGGRILVILSDAESGDQERLMATLVDCRRRGIVVLALGIGAEGCERVYGSRFGVDLKEPTRLYDTLAHLLDAQYRRG